MNSDQAALVKKLNEGALTPEEISSETMHWAANEIESLTAENERLRAALKEAVCFVDLPERRASLEKALGLSHD